MTATVTTSLSSIATDPIRNFKFQCIIRPSVGSALYVAGATSPISALGFMTASGLQQTTEVIPYRQGGYNSTTQKMPGQSDFSPLSLSRGVLLGTSQNWDYTREIFDVMQGTGTGSRSADFRSNTDVQVLDHPVTASTKVPIKMWFRLFRTWPSAISYTDLDAGGNGFMVEQMTLVHEGFVIAFASNKAGSDIPAAPSQST